jgi:hypothetical protein
MYLDNSNTKERLLLDIGIFIIMFIAYRLLVLERIPYNISERISFLQVIIILSIMLWNIVEIISIVREIQKTKPGRLSLVIKKIIDKIYWGPLALVEARILKIRGIVQVLHTLSYGIVKLITTKFRIYVVLITLMILPRLALGVCLMLDVLYFQRIALMYKAISLMIIPISFYVIVGMVKHQISKDKLALESSSLIVTYEKEQPYLQSKENALEKYESNKENWIKYYNILDTIKAIEILKTSKYILIMRAICALVMLVSWLIHLLIIIFVLYQKYMLWKYVRLIKYKNG